MDKEATVPEKAMQLFMEQAVTVSRSRAEVSIQCNSAEDACTVFEWLAGVRDRIESGSSITPRGTTYYAALLRAYRRIEDVRNTDDQRIQSFPEKSDEFGIRVNQADQDLQILTEAFRELGYQKPRVKQHRQA